MLTNVGLEHARWLGPTIADIAGEKLAVVKRRRRRWCSATTRPRSSRWRGRTGAKIVRPAPLALDLPGYQRMNFAATVAAATDRSTRRIAHGRRPPRRTRAPPGRRARPADARRRGHDTRGITVLAECVREGAVGDLSSPRGQGRPRRCCARCCRACGGRVHARAQPSRKPAGRWPTSRRRSAASRARSNPSRSALLSGARAGRRGRHLIATGSIYLVAELLSAPGAKGERALNEAAPVRCDDRARSDGRRARRSGLLRHRLRLRPRPPTDSPPDHYAFGPHAELDLRFEDKKNHAATIQPPTSRCSCSAWSTSRSSSRLHARAAPDR